MSEEEKDGALAPAEPVHTPLSEIVDKPRMAGAPRIAEPKPEPKQTKPQKQERPAVPEGYVPLREVLDERDRYKSEKERADRYEKAWAEHQRKLQAEQDNDPAPDMFKDPNAYNAWIDRQLNKRAESIARQHVQPIMAQVTDATLRLSELQAEKNLGPERFGKLNEWIKGQGQQFQEWALTQPDPYWAAYQQYRQRTTFERLGDDDLETYEQKMRDRLKAEILAEMQGPADPDDGFEDDAPPQRKAAPQSFASSRNADPKRDQGGRFTGPRPLGELVREKDQRKKR